MSPPEMRRPRHRSGAGADTYTTTTRHLLPHDRLPVQLSLFGQPTEPEDLMYPPRAWNAAEWHLRLAVNRMAYDREPRHWWAREAERRRTGAA